MDPKYLEALRRNFALELDRLGRFHYEGEPIEHPRVDAFFRQALELDPKGEPIVMAPHPTRAGDVQWAYLTVEDTLYRVNRIRLDAQGLHAYLDDGRQVDLDPASLQEDETGLRCLVPTRQHERLASARLRNAAAADLAPMLEEAEDGVIVLRIGDQTHRLVSRREP